ncbi:hypothetical protein SAMN06295943_0172 [Agreia sp. VKM Ac-1783]|nr:hypothetical protein SAMN06295943_0172 [Agreia sp. VKM Ac-1783]
MKDEIPPRITRLFGNDKARPKVVRVYAASSGWAQAPGSPVATWPVIDELLRQGRTSAEVKWRFTSHTVSILDLKRAVERVDWSSVAKRSARRGSGEAN